MGKEFNKGGYQPKDTQEKNSFGKNQSSQNPAQTTQNKQKPLNKEQGGFQKEKSWTDKTDKNK